MMRRYFSLIIGLSFVANSADTNIPYDNIVTKYSNKYGLDRLLIHAQIEQESKHNPKACSSAGACGLMQLMAPTAKDLGVDRSNNEQNVAGGTRYMKQMLKMFNGNTVNALRAYNWGPGAMKFYLKGNSKKYNKLPPETKNYPIHIRNYYFNKYHGKGNHFNGFDEQIGGKSKKQTKHNPNINHSKESLTNLGECKPVHLPQWQSKGSKALDIDRLGTTLISNMSGGDPVYDPVANARALLNAQQYEQRFQELRKQYLNLVFSSKIGAELIKTNTIAGFEVPENITLFAQEADEKNTNENKDNEKNEKGVVFSDLKDSAQANLGVYTENPIGLTPDQVLRAEAISNIMAKIEMSWTQVNCSINNIHHLFVKKESNNDQKVAKDIDNAILIEKGILMGLEAQIKSYVINIKAVDANLKRSQERQSIMEFFE